MLPFRKYQATGNDFVMIDNRNAVVAPDAHALFAQLCHRRFGIGADGVILLQNHSDSAFEMLYYNADGNPSTLCGNGGRSVVRFAEALGICTEQVAFQAIDGLHHATIQPHYIGLEMALPYDLAHYSPTESYLHTGSPHHVVWVPNPQAIDVRTEGARIRYAEQYQHQGGTNVNFVQVQAPGQLHMRTYERGVEDETYSCGTGVTAAAYLHHLQHTHLDEVRVHTAGGELWVTFRDGRPWLCGPAQEVFVGQWPA